MLCICNHNSSTLFRLRGLGCQKSAVDRLYKPLNTNEDVRNFIFRGDGGTDIRFVNGAWEFSVMGSDITGGSWASQASYTLGKVDWSIYGDDACDLGSSSTVQLKLTGCQDGSFTCDNGQCVAMDKRCNQLTECSDKSDEKDCNLVVLEDSYNKNIPPISSSGEGRILPVQVLVSIDLFSLVRINEERHSIEFQFRITLEWKENRANYYNLKDTESLNILMQEDVERLWLPEVIYENTDQKESTRLGMNWEWVTSVVVKKQGQPTMSDLSSLDEKEIFSGSENSLLVKQIYTHEFQCIYNLKYYPFDTQAGTFKSFEEINIRSYLDNYLYLHFFQTCKIDMGLREIYNETITLVPKQLRMIQERNMISFSIK